MLLQSISRHKIYFEIYFIFFKIQRWWKITPKNLEIRWADLTIKLSQKTKANHCYFLLSIEPNYAIGLPVYDTFNEKYFF